jgi:hypothetical protein
LDDLLEEVTKVYTDPNFIIELTTYHEETLFADAPKEGDEVGPDEGENLSGKKKKYANDEVEELLNEMKNSKLAMVQ